MAAPRLGVKYGPDDRPPLVVTFFGGLQWVGFVVASNIMVPLVLGDAFGLTAPEVASLTQRILLLIGVVSLLQVLWGHRLPISEGVSYVWLGFFAALAGVERGAGHDPRLVLPQLEAGLMASGLVMAALALTGLTGRLQRLFTPTVVATYLMLLPIQFSGPFLRSMLGAGSAGGLDLRVTAISLLTVVVTLAFSLWGRGVVKSISSLLGLVVGVLAWFAAGLPVGGGLPQAAPAAGVMPGGFFFAWGAPQWNAGLAATCVLTGLLLLSNVLASLAAVEQVTGDSAEGSFRRTTAVHGAGGFLAGILSGVGLVPVASSVGFISLTGLASRLPFYLSCVLLAGVAFLAPLARLVTLLPLPLAYAATFAAFNEMFGLGVLRLRSAPLTRGNLATLSLSVFVGTGLMFVPPAALAGLAPAARNLLGNGLLTGALLSLILEHLVFRKVTTLV